MAYRNGITKWADIFFCILPDGQKCFINYNVTLSKNPATGDVLICDNDNVVGHGQYSGILGKARYKAPEVVRGDKQPDKNTDRHSLAVILFMLLVGDHPLEGKRTNVPILTDKYDAPVPGLHKNAISMWKFFPSFMHDAFRQSFSHDSLMNAHGRLLEQDWFNILMRLKSSIARCPQCGSEIFLESDRETICKAHRIKPSGYLNLDKRSNQVVTVPIFKDIVLYNYHLDSASEDFKTIAAVIREKPGKFGLENKSDRRWTIIASDGRTSVKQPNETAVLSANFKIDFGNGNAAFVVSN